MAFSRHAKSVRAPKVAHGRAARRWVSGEAFGMAVDSPSPRPGTGLQGRGVPRRGNRFGEIFTWNAAALW